jgi:chromosome segregation ATPase
MDWTQFLGVGVAGVIVAAGGFVTGIMIARARTRKIAAEAEVKKAEAEATIILAQAEADKIRAEAAQAEAEADATDAVTITNTHNADLERFRKIMQETQKSYRDALKSYERDISELRARVEKLEGERREAVNRETLTNAELTNTKKQLEASQLDILNMKDEIAALKKALGDKDLAIQERDARLQLVILENERLHREFRELNERVKREASGL